MHLIINTRKEIASNDIDDRIFDLLKDVASNRMDGGSCKHCDAQPQRELSELVSGWLIVHTLCETLHTSIESPTHSNGLITKMLMHQSVIVPDCWT